MSIGNFQTCIGTFSFATIDIILEYYNNIRRTHNSNPDYACIVKRLHIIDVVTTPLYRKAPRWWLS